VLHREIALPGVSVKFYKAIVQSVLLYGSKLWVLSKAVLRWPAGLRASTFTLHSGRQRGKCTLSGAPPPVDLSTFQQSAQGVWDAHNSTLHRCAAAELFVYAHLRHTKNVVGKMTEG
jgi:hypothetical protein